MNEIRPIRSEKDYEAALAEIERNFFAARGTAEGDRAAVLEILVEAYEREHYPLGDLNPIEAIEIRMEDLKLARADLVPVFGTRGRVSEVLNRKRRLSLEHIRALAKLLTLPLDVLAAPYELAREKRRVATKRVIRRPAGRKAPARRAA